MGVGNAVAVVRTAILLGLAYSGGARITIAVCCYFLRVGGPEAESNPHGFRRSVRLAEDRLSRVERGEER